MPKPWSRSLANFDLKRIIQIFAISFACLKFLVVISFAFLIIYNDIRNVPTSTCRIMAALRGFPTAKQRKRRKLFASVNANRIVVTLSTMISISDAYNSPETIILSIIPSSFSVKTKPSVNRTGKK